jgi:triacylglycerol lipase
MRRRNKAFPLTAFLSFLFLLLSCVSARKSIKPADADSEKCATRYPILLVHGIMVRDDYPIAYWGRIPEALIAEGATVYLANHDAWASIEDNAAVLDTRILEIMAATGARKVNIIAHSKGGLESRYLISTLARGDRVASLTTINTPHRGAPFADILLDDIPLLNDVTGLMVDTFSRYFLRDDNPNVKWAISQLRPESMAAFNEKNQDDPRVYYQSWTSTIDSNYPSLVFAFMYKLTAAKEGPNDGVVSVDSAKWGNYRGLVFAGSQMSHSDVADFHVYSYPGVPDVLPFYVEMAADLKERGF